MFAKCTKECKDQETGKEEETEKGSHAQRELALRQRKCGEK